MSKAGASLATCYGPVSADVMAKAENIRLLILDVDGDFNIRGERTTNAITVTNIERFQLFAVIAHI
ncbi:3-deoxy-D-manno-octulosonate 8-phosphate phosphatas KdsC domain protein, partial [Escherichia coli p0305293.9]